MDYQQYNNYTDQKTIHTTFFCFVVMMEVYETCDTDRMKGMP